MIIGGYTLDLYCENEGDANHHRLAAGGESYYGSGHIHEWEKYSWQFVGQTFAGCVRLARKAGWKINTTKRTALCPFCAKKKGE